MIDVERLTSLDEFDGVRKAYERVYALDPERTVFVSWPWVRAFLVTMAHRWTLLAAKAGDEHVGFLLVVHQGAQAGPVPLFRELGLGAYPTADYTSMLVAGDEAAVIAAFASTIDSMRWDVLRARSVRDPRIATLVAQLSDGKTMEREAATPCHVVALPPSFDEYVKRDRDGKQILRYALRRRNTWNAAPFTDADATTIDRDVEALLQLHHERWKTNLDKARRTYGHLFREAHANGCCRVSVLWSAEKRPLAAQAAFVDPERRTWSIYMLAYDRDASKHSPGIGMLMRGIERAISERFTEYDFLRGGESYKSKFDSEIRWLDNFTIRRRSSRVHAAEHLWGTATRAKRALRTFIVGRVRASA
jgi:CelD/BcsL family acetyltransferase involved in cellulose biosynthesis